LGYGIELRHGFSLFRQFEAQLAACIGFAVESLGGCRRATYFAEGEEFYLEITRVASDLEEVAEMDFAGRLGRLSVRFDSAEITGSGGDGASLEESGGPEPLVHSHASQRLIVKRDYLGGVTEIFTVFLFALFSEYLAIYQSRPPASDPLCSRTRTKRVSIRTTWYRFEYPERSKRV
jgi:hypothetical protein